MAYIYEVKHSDGQTYQVPTDYHHSELSEQEFREILLRTISGVAGSLISGLILHYTFKGRR